MAKAIDPAIKTQVSILQGKLGEIDLQKQEHSGGASSAVLSSITKKLLQIHQQNKYLKVVVECVAAAAECA